MSEIVQSAQEEFLSAVHDQQVRSQREQELQRIATFSKQAGIQNFLGTLRSASLEQQRTFLTRENVTYYQQRALEGLELSLRAFRPVLEQQEYPEDRYDLPYIVAWIETLERLLFTQVAHHLREEDELPHA
jgi:hypothetical protein